MRGRLPLVSVAVACVIAPCLRAASARGDDAPLPLALDWQVPPECPSADFIRAELARIARVQPGRAPTPLAAKGTIQRDGGHLRLWLRTTRNGEVGERRLVSNDCRSLGREVTLVLAVAFGEGVEMRLESAAPASGNAPDGPPRAPASPQAPAPTSTSASPRAPALPPTATPAPPSATRNWRAVAAATRHDLFVGGGILLGALPAPAALVTLGGDLGASRLWLSPRLTWLPRVDDALARGIDARYDGVGGALALCTGAPAVAASLAACVGGAASALRGRASAGSNAERPAAEFEGGSATAPWYSGSVAASVTWPRARAVAVRLEAQLQMSFNDPRFAVVGLGEVHRVPRLAPSLSLVLVLTPGPERAP